MDDPQLLDRPLRVVGRYAMYGKLAAGGMATVHFGRLLGPAGFSRTVAIKRLHPQFARDPEFVAMFLDEARLAARIQHPNVAATVDVVAMGDELFLVMDYIRGESFSRLLRASRKRGIDVPVGVIGSIVAGMLHGLHAAHEAKDEHGQPLSVVHRDVSPQNVLVGIDGVSRVLDFGVAKAAARVQVTRDGQMKGKLSYMAPEQLQARGVDRRTDVFAAGIVLWEALTGRRLFDADEAQEVLRMILTEEIPPPSAVVPSISRDIDAIVMKALQRDPRLRFQSAREFAIALEEATQLCSPREVGEWVEKVAGDTLYHRERAVAEIEAISAVSEPSSISESSPGFLKTLNDRTPPPGLYSDGNEWDDAPTGVFDPTKLRGRPAAEPPPAQVPQKSVERRPSVPPRPGPRTPSVPPRASASPSSVPPRPASAPVAPPRAKKSMPPPLRRNPAPQGAPKAVFDDENEATSVFDAARHIPSSPLSKPRPPGAAPKPGVAVLPVKSVTDDGNEKTQIHKAHASPASGDAPPPLPANHLFDDEGEKTSIYEEPHVPPKATPRFDDENETTSVYDTQQAEVPLVSNVENIISEVPSEADRMTEPPKLRGAKPAPKAEAAAGAAHATGATIIVQDDITDPSIQRRKALAATTTISTRSVPPPPSTKRGVMVRAGLWALLIVMSATLGGVLFSKPRRRAAPASEAVHDVRHVPVPAAVAPKEPEKEALLEPSAAPAPSASAEPAVASPAPTAEEPAEERLASEKSRTHARTASRVRSPSPPPAPAIEPAAAPAPAKPAPTPPADDDSSPYAGAMAAAATRPASTASKPPPPPKPSYEESLDVDPYAKTKKKAASTTKQAAVDCRQPYYVDDQGIRRIRPECL